MDLTLTPVGQQTLPGNLTNSIGQSETGAFQKLLRKLQEETVASALVQPPSFEQNVLSPDTLKALPNLVTQLSPAAQAASFADSVPSISIDVPFLSALQMPSIDAQYPAFSAVAAQSNPDSAASIVPSLEGELPVLSADAAQTVSLPLQTDDAGESYVDTQERDAASSKAQPLDVRSQLLFDQVRSVPIRVADAPATVEASELTPKLQSQIDSALEQGITRVELKLSPETLGTVTVELHHDQGGAIRVSLSASTERAQNLLEKHTHGLQLLLSDSTQSNVTVTVDRRANDLSAAQHPYDREGDTQSNRQSNQQSNQQPRQQSERHRQDFLECLRLGLTDTQAC